MFKFLRELMDSAREGVAEAKAELAEEAAAKDAASKSAALALDAQLGEVPPYERFVAALAAPYKQTYTREIQAAVREQRPAVYLFCLDLPPDEGEASVRAMLDRDFAVTDEETLEATVQDMADVYVDAPEENADPAGRALWMVRGCYLISASASVGFVTRARALVMAEPFVRFAASRFSGWDEFGRYFLEGERAAGGTNVLGRKFLKDSVECLGESPLSPWRQVPWPTTPAEVGALIGSVAQLPTQS